MNDPHREAYASRIGPTRDPADVTPLDGRVARSRRTRAAIVDALVDLLETGRVQPTIEEIAAHAGVSPRTVFQHYADREALFAAVGAQRSAQLEQLMGDIDAGAALPARVDAVVAQRGGVFEWIAPVRRAALLMEPFSDNTHAALDGFRIAKRADVARVFAAEITARPDGEGAELAAALGAVGSWSFWSALRDQQGLDVEQASAVLRRTLLALLAAD